MRFRTISACMMICMLSIVLVCSTAWPVSRGSFAPSVASTLQQVLDRARAFLAEPGAVLLVEAPGGAQWIGASGVSRISGIKNPVSNQNQWIGPGMSPDLHFRIASVTKTFTATVVLQLVGEGKCSLDDTVLEILGDITPGCGRITVRMLLGMTSGLFNYVADPGFFKALLDKPLKNYEPRDLIEIANRAGGGRLDFQPGRSWAYCNTNYILLGMIIEKLTGRPYHQVVTERIIRPLGLAHTLAPPPGRTGLPAPFAHGYFFTGETKDQFKDITLQDPSAAWSAGCIISTAGDMAVWLKALAAGTLLKETQRRAMFTWTKTDTHHEFQYYGLGVSKYCGAVGHIGSIPGYRACIYQYQGYNFVVLLNGYRTVTDYKGHYALYVFRKAAEALGLSFVE